MKIQPPELVLDARAELAEGPAWDAPNGRLLWVNIPAGEVHIFDPAHGTDRAILVGEPVGCVVPHGPGTVALARSSGFALLDLESGAVAPLVDPEPHLPGNRFNDGKCDPTGRFLAGTMDDAEQEASGSLYSLDASGQVRCLVSGVRISNGLAWSPDYRTLYYSDTPTRKIVAYDYDLVTGAIANARALLSVEAADGMTSDRQGRLWIAQWNGGCISVWDPETARQVALVPIPALHVTSCVFAGADLNELYVTTARKGGTPQELAELPYSGGLFRVITNVEGMPTFPASLALP